jgi:Tol biopolymer transport system component/tRNA A-37 threonylcarbamoyl transferase component Bud32
MRRDRWERIETLLDAALDLPQGERAAFLERECPDDPALRSEVLKILEAGEEPATLLDRPAARVAAVVSEITGEMPVAIPERVGPYRIEQVIGQGGMGTVFLAHRDDGEFDQRVALKLVRRGPHLDARVVRRFREERQILAALNHPGIARLLDGGIAEDGLPFFAMEYVEGETITEYCDRRALGIEERLALFVRVCDALAHAHEKYIVHRDIKPSNILVTREGNPRLLDFGIAKLLAPDDPSAAIVITRRSERFLTPEYASPEQIKGEPVGIAADVYCLGVLLYELLTAKRPFRRAEQTAHELERAVLEDDPTRPSEAAGREPLGRRLRGDLDAIVLTAMSKEPARRYRGAAEMAADVRRHLAGQPVTARSASPAYLIRRWGRRHRVAVGSAAAGALLAAVVATLLARAPADLVPGPARRVAFDEALELDPALSPDGKAIAYAEEAGSRFRIVVRQVEGRAVPVAGTLPGSQWQPRWSPDGGRILFQAGGAIYTVSAVGGAPRLLIRPSRPDGWVASPAWSPDGRMIAYVENWAIYVRPASGGPPTRISQPRAAHSLAWSPDGRWIAFVSGNPAFVSGESPRGSSANLGNIAPSSIWVVRAGGGEPVAVTDARALNTSPVWLPAGRTLLFVSNREGSRDIYRVDLDPSGRPTAQPARLTTGLSAHTFSVSGDGQRLAYSAFTFTGNVWTLDVPRGGPVSLTDARPLTEGTQVIEGMTLSPDGRWLAFDSDRTGNQDVYKVSLEGGDPVRLTSAPEDEFVSTWSADGREIAGHSYRGGDRWVRLLPADGGEPREIGRSPPNQRSPGLAPDGRGLVFTSDATGELQLYVVSRANNAAWGVPRQLTSRGGWAGRWAPDGHAIAYCRQDGVWLISPRGGTPSLLVKADEAAGLPAPELALWSPDSRTIYYKAFDAFGHSSLWSIPAGGGTPSLLVRFDDPSRPSSRPEFATDGKRLFFTVGARQSDIWVMELRKGR